MNLLNQIFTLTTSAAVAINATLTAVGKVGKIAEARRQKNSSTVGELDSPAGE
ncbi:hypothetical protein KGQ20_20670 [Catenulispora sp. NF23]|uniref:Uncharacterized protein n=1 Tax=Catenulispora pinistramenti TaxID=2705254 RepID=A0ABS5KT41_9ACTN|nr:hypothetical protein [Catenulispora pinistramenti]MBS2535181.1 hypothetical protein [Catenulispora pinistramenti]MBS2549179.1 hypothetical protein [Catenulispora pinistramenti]